jgi:hypothetical protein
METPQTRFFYAARQLSLKTKLDLASWSTEHHFDVQFLEFDQLLM